ncbi:hypothetical protein VVT58_19500 (plasmid) [Sphingobium sp. SJ10-10]|nr:hypothetical protein [Sphingobium sp. SJ10-10]
MQPRIRHLTTYRYRDAVVLQPPHLMLASRGTRDPKSLLRRLRSRS